MYNKALQGLLVFSLIAGIACAQDISTSTSNIAFSTTEIGQSDTQTVVIYNNGLFPEQLEGLTLLTYYGDTVFRTIQAFPATLLAMDSFELDLIFKPKHNLSNKGYAIVKTGGSQSPIRINLNGDGKFNLQYLSTNGLEGELLRRELAKIAAQGHISLGYNGARDRMFMNIDNKRTNGQGATQNTLECPYTGRVITNYANRSAAQNSPHNFNTEHTFPQSLFPTNDTMKSDLHHLYATDANSNSQRGNLPFGVLTNWTWTEGGSRRGSAAFEPRDAQKGQSARSVLYFGIRYMHNSGVSRTFIAGQEATLKSWNDEYPPTSAEIRRNNDIATAQGNRNPLVDYPQFLSRMTQIANTAKEPRWKDPVLVEDSLDLGSINAGEVVTYEYVFCNQGTDSIRLSNISINDPTVVISSSPGSVTAGGCAIIKLIASGDGNNHAFELKFDDNSSGTISYSIPIVFSGNVGFNELLGEDLFRVLRNGQYLYVGFKYDNLLTAGTCRLLDLSGKEIAQVNISDGQSNARINIDGLASTVYIVELTQQDGFGIKKLIKRIVISE